MDKTERNQNPTCFCFEGQSWVFSLISRSSLHALLKSFNTKTPTRWNLHVTDLKTELLVDSVSVGLKRFSSDLIHQAEIAGTKSGNGLNQLSISKHQHKISWRNVPSVIQTCNRIQSQLPAAGLSIKLRGWEIFPQTKPTWAYLWILFIHEQVLTSRD